MKKLIAIAVIVTIGLTSCSSSNKCCSYNNYNKSKKSLPCYSFNGE